MRWLYDIGLGGYGWMIAFAALFNNKARQWRDGRKDIFKKIENQVEKGAIWIHAASLGEFEQGRPLIEAIKKKYPNQKILLTFFSPSGYEIRKNYPLADYVFYLPLDNQKNAKRFIELTQPRLAIFIKYEFWYHYIHQLAIRDIPIFSVSAIFRPSQRFFKWHGKWFRKMLLNMEHIFVQNETSLQLLHDFNINNTTLAGDTRVDRVWDIRQNAPSFPLIEAFKDDKKVLIAGSTWQTDEAILGDFCKNNTPLPFKIIIAPHEIQESHIQQILKILPPHLNVCRYSEAAIQGISTVDILIIDNIGMLSAIYQYGDWAYIGGAFESGLHNTLEPIAFGLPLVFGQKYSKFEEARWLVEHGGGFSITGFDDFEKIIIQLQKPVFYQKASEQALKYIEANRGATDLVMQRLSDWLVVLDRNTDFTN